MKKTTIAVIDEQPAIDPETLPIVQELREQLAKVTKERDAAIKYLKVASYDKGYCYGCKWFDEVTEKCLGILECDSDTNNMWEWIGTGEKNNG